MKYILAFVLLGITLAGCETTTPYNAGDYTKTDWATMPFDQAKATCRDAHLQHNKLWDTYELETPKFKAYMERYGWRYNTRP